jgi:alpha-glucoside transport system substrate-binding protein
MKSTNRVLAAGAAFAVAGLVLAGCSAPAAAPAEGDGAVTIYGGYGEAQAAAFQQELDAFGEENGIDITFTSLASFDTDIKVKIEAGEEPDIALWPQPGGLLDQAEAGTLSDLNDVTGFDLNAPLETLVPGWDSLAVQGDAIYGLPVSANVKTLVFFNPSAFAANGYTVPTTDAELTALIDQIKADGSGYPFCAGIESGGATGWAITDWTEQYVLDYAGLDVYNQWIAGDVTFDSPEVTQATDKIAEMLLTEGNVNGGGISMATDGFGNTAPLFETGGKEKGQCFMIRQGSFITDFFPDNIKAELAAGDYTNADVFALPAPEGAQAGVLGGGDLAAVFDGHVDADVAKVYQFITSDKVGAIMAAASSFTSPHATFDSSLYPNEMTKKVGETMANAEVFGFDGSDRMPSEVNAEFWAAGTEWVAGKITWAEAAARIQSKY